MTQHSHSITCTLSSLAQLADLLGDACLLRRVRAFFDNGLWKMRDKLGWSPERALMENCDDGEMNNTGDILETALLLGRHGGPAAPGVQLYRRTGLNLDRLCHDAARSTTRRSILNPPHERR